MSAIVPGSAPLIAREEELSGITGACGRAFDDQAPVVALVLGDAGTGKSRLLQESVTLLTAARDPLVLNGFAMPGEGHPPYFALGRAVRRLARLPGLEHAVQPTTLPLLAAVELWPPVPSASVPPLDAAEGRVRLFEALSDLFTAAAAVRPVVVVLDDMQWASGADWDAIAHAVRAVDGPLAFVIAARPEIDDTGSAAATALHELTRNRRVFRTQLRALTDMQVAALAATLLGAPMTGELASLVQHTTQGNPFLVEELCVRLEAEDCLVPRDGAWALSPAASRVPEAASFALLQRFAELPERSRALVELAAVTGRVGSNDELARISGIALGAIPGLLGPARQGGILEADGQAAWAFPHDIVREAVLRSIQSPGELHRRIARALTSDPNAHARAIATHWAAAGEPLEAARVALAASAAASTRFAPYEALELARLAVEQAVLAAQISGKAPVAEAEATLADAALEAAELQVAEGAYGRLETLAANLGDDLLVGRARIGLGMVARRRERPDEAVLHLRAGVHALTALPGAEAHVVRARITLATVYGLTQAHYALADAEASLAAEAARALGDAGLESEALLAIANSRVRAVGPTAAREELESALDRALAGRQLQVAAEAAASLSNNYYWTGELRRARHFGQLRLDVATQAHDAFGLRHGRSWLALLAASAGSWAEALALLKEDEVWLQRLESPEPFAFARLVASFVHLRIGEFETAYDEVTAAVGRLLPLGDGTLLWYAGLGAVIAAAAGHAPEAIAAAAVQEARLRAVDDSALPARSARCALGLAYARLGMSAEGAECEARLRPYAADYHWWPARLTLAELALLRRDTATALSDIDAALAATRREGQLADTALLLDARARALGPGNPQSRAVLHEARVIAGQTGVRLPDGGPISGSIPAANLTPRELEVLRLVADGLSNHDIAERLVVSERTVINHVSHIFDKLDVDSRSAAAAWAIRSGIA